MFIDDIDGGPAEGTVGFGLDGTDYEIDLSAAHGEELQRSRRVRRPCPPGRRHRPARVRGARADVPDARKVREWARAEGIDIKERGRVPAEVIKKYKAARA